MRIREAQAIRGHRLRGLRDWRPLVLPLLVGGLERAMNLAEAMVSRGYGATAGTRHSQWVRLALLGGLAFLFGGWFLLFWLGWPGGILAAAGALLLAFLYARLGRGTPHTTYRPRRWTGRDSLLLGTAVFSFLLLFLPLPLVDRATLSYTPYPTLSLPPFDPLLGLVLALLAMPALAR